MASRDALYETTLELRDLLIAYATGQGAQGDEGRYQDIREELLEEPMVRTALPSFVRRHRTLGEFWSFIKGESPRYEPRRIFLREQFADVLDMLEFSLTQPGDAPVGTSLRVLSSEHVESAWAKALERRTTDPEGAITAARTLLETVCKHILDDTETPYDDKADLPGLYALAAKELNLSPSQHEEKIFKQILGGAQSVVEGLGSIRNRLSDSHGRGRSGARPGPRHATLAVNLAGSIAGFLVATWAEREGIAEE